MTLTINLTPSEEERLQAAAQQNGVGPAEFAHQLLSRHLFPTELAAPSIKIIPRRLSGYGMFAHVPGGSEAFALEKQQEIEREDTKFEPRS